jgi:biotin carboxylase
VTAPAGRTLAVAYGPRSAPVMQLAEAAAGECDLVWLIDGRIEETQHTARLLTRFGPVVDIGGLDTKEAAALLAPHAPDGLATYFDAGLVDLARLAEALGIGFYTPATAEALVDKARQRRVLAEAGLEMPTCMVLPTGPPRRALARLDPGLTWPVVLKPRSESGSRHTFLAHDAAEAADLLESVGADLEEMVVEEYLAGDPARASDPFADYVSVESIVAGGVVSHVAVTGRFPPAPTFRETGFFIPALLTDSDQADVLALAERAILALGVTVGCLHTEIKFTPGGPRLIEVNGRIGGGIPDMLERAAGVPLLRLSFQVALGLPVRVDGPVHCDHVGYRFFLQPPQITGTVTAITGIDTLASHPGFDNLIVHRGPGSWVDWKDGSRTFILAVVGEAPDHDAVIAIERALRQEVTVTYEPASATPA